MMMSPGLRVDLGYPDEDLIIRSYGSMPYPGSSSGDYPHTRGYKGSLLPFKGPISKGLLPVVAGKTQYIHVVLPPQSRIGCTAYHIMASAIMVCTNMHTKTTVQIASICLFETQCGAPNLDLLPSFPTILGTEGFFGHFLAQKRAKNGPKSGGRVTISTPTIRFWTPQKCAKMCIFRP